MEVLDWAMRLTVVFGLPGVLINYVRKRVVAHRRRRLEEIEGDVQEATIQDRIQSSSITTLEAQRVALVAAWEAERKSMQGTIEFQAEQLRQERAYSASRDAVIAELREQVDRLQSELSAVATKIRQLQQGGLPA